MIHDIWYTEYQSTLLLPLDSIFGGRIPSRWYLLQYLSEFSSYTGGNALHEIQGRKHQYCFEAGILSTEHEVNNSLMSVLETPPYLGSEMIVDE